MLQYVFMMYWVWIQITYVVVWRTLQDVTCDAQWETWLCVCVSCRHERIHTKRGGHMKTQTDADEVEDLATLEVLDEVRRSTVWWHWSFMSSQPTRRVNIIFIPCDDGIRCYLYYKTLIWTQLKAGRSRTFCIVLPPIIHVGLLNNCSENARQHLLHK